MARRFSAPAGSPASEDAAEDDRSAALLLLLVSSLERGHRYLAVRYYLMMMHCGYQMPGRLVPVCSQLLASCPKPKRQRVGEQVRAWLEMLHPCGAAGASFRRPSGWLQQQHDVMRPLPRSRRELRRHRAAGKPRALARAETASNLPTAGAATGRRPIPRDKHHQLHEAFRPLRQPS